MGAPAKNTNNLKTQLNTRQLEALRRMVEEGHSGKRVRTDMGIHLTLWEKWRGDGMFVPMYEQMLKEYEQAVRDTLRAGAQAAATTLLALQTDTAVKESVRLMAANSVLDRTGYKHSEKIQVQAQPFATREEMVAALRAIPADVLAEALAAAGQD